MGEMAAIVIGLAPAMGEASPFIQGKDLGAQILLPLPTATA